LVSIVIGGGAGFSSIDWSAGQYFIETKTDIIGGTSYTITGTSQLLSVPYALHAKTADNSITTAQANAITDNTSAISTLQSEQTTQNTAIALNTAKVGITTAQTTKLAGIAEGAEVNVQADWNQVINTADDYIKNKPTIPAAADGSETKVTAGTNVTVTGSGTTTSPYVVNATSSTPLAIGQSYGGGVIFWIDASGQHGLIAATINQSTSILWCNGTYTTTGATLNAVYAGMSNANKIIANQGAGSYAAQVCADYSVTVNNEYYDDWYLPSKYELNLLYLQKTAVGGFASAIYWSSCEYDNYSASAQYFVNGAQYSMDKIEAAYVRAVRAF
jgi:hypothetical protein